MTSANAFGDWPMKQNDSIISWYTILGNQTINATRYHSWGYGSFGSPVHDDAIYSIIVWDIWYLIQVSGHVKKIHKKMHFLM